MTIRWVVEKKESTSNIGLTFGGPRTGNANDIHPTFIWTVKGGRMKKIDIIPGLRIVKINDKWVRNADHADRIVKFAQAGPVSLETYGKYYAADKISKDQKAGLALCVTKFPLTLPNGLRTVQELVEITKVNPEGMFPEVTKGHILWGINGTKITSVTQAIKLLRKRRSLRLVVLDPDTLDATVKSVVSNVATSEPMPQSEPVPPPEPVEETPVPPPSIPPSPVITVIEKSFDCEEEDSISMLNEDETTLVEGDEEFEGPALWC